MTSKLPFFDSSGFMESFYCPRCGTLNKGRLQRSAWAIGLMNNCKNRCMSN